MENPTTTRAIGVIGMLSILVGGLIFLATGTGPLAAGTDSGWSCPGASVKYDNLSGATYTVRNDAIDVWIKAGPDHYSFGPQRAGAVLQVKTVTGHDTSHAHECTPTDTTVVTIQVTTTVPEVTTTLPEPTTTPETTTTVVDTTTTSIYVTTVPQTTVVDTTTTTTVPESTTTTEPPEVTTTTEPPRRTTTTTTVPPYIPPPPVTLPPTR